jgi:uncharacterized membrane protein
MTKTRLEAFSDGVVAIIITILVLELKIPHEPTWEALFRLLPVFLAYIMSFIFVGIYWVNHHHLVHTIRQINSRIMWSNFGLLFALSLIPFTTAWMGENHYATIPVVLYAINLVFCAITYTILQKSIMSDHNRSSRMIEALKKQEKKGYISLSMYLLSVPLAYILPVLSAVIFAAVAILWIIPDKNIEAALKEHEN